jgi:hypothetical protein
VARFTTTAVAEPTNAVATVGATTRIKLVTTGLFLFLVLVIRPIEPGTH